MARLALAGLMLAILAGPAAAQRTPLFSLGGGLAFPSGDAADVFDMGFGVTSAGVFPLTGSVGLEVNAHYNRLHVDQDLAIAGLGYDPDTFTQAGGYLEGGYRWAAALTAGARLSLRPPSSRLVPHLSVGAGGAKVGTHEIRTLYLGDAETYPGSSEVVFLASGGAGLDMGLSPGVSLFGMVRYLVAFTDPERTTMIPVTLGLSLRLEER